MLSVEQICKTCWLWTAANDLTGAGACAKSSPRGTVREDGKTYTDEMALCGHWQERPKRGLAGGRNDV